MVTMSRGRSSERIAKGVLQELGYRILETNKSVLIDQAEAFEVDIIALSPEGEEYCVEVKAGRAGVSDIRHVYADSEVLGLKPLLVCKGFANEAAEAVAMELGVKVVRLSEHFLLLEPEELEVVVRTAMRDILNEYGFYPLPPWEAIGDEDWELIEGLARSDSFEDVARHLHLNAEELGHRIGDLREDGVFPQGGQSFTELKRHSQQLIHRYSLDRRLEKIEMRLKRLEESC
jgi:predicted RecB family endonuclease